MANDVLKLDIDPIGGQVVRAELEKFRDTEDKVGNSNVVLMTDRPGELTFPINQRLTGVVTVSDAEVAEAVRYAFKVLKLVVEPGGAVSLAAVLAGKVETAGLTTAVVLSGGNVDPSMFSAIIEDRFTPGA